MFMFWCLKTHLRIETDQCSAYGLKEFEKVYSFTTVYVACCQLGLLTHFKSEFISDWEQKISDWELGISNF